MKPVGMFSNDGARPSLATATHLRPAPEIINWLAMRWDPFTNEMKTMRLCGTEHNCIVVTACQQLFAEGVVLDAWRHSGRPWFGSVATDKYPWQPLRRERVAPELKKLLTK